jgi:hypothetical protein
VSRREQKEAEELSRQVGPALSQGFEGDELPEIDDYDEDFDPDLSDMNDPDMDTLPPPPLLGSTSSSSDMFGQPAETYGRAASPKLWSQALQFPQAVQFRVWKYENGIPSALGAISIRASEEDFVRAFYPSMPKKGESRAEFALRPIDLRGNELGKELGKAISEHHVTLRAMREVEEQEHEDRLDRLGGGRSGGGGGDVHVHGGGGEGGNMAFEEMGRMFEHAVEAADDRTRMLQDEVTAARDRLRADEQSRANERVQTAERATSTVEKMTERLMASDRQRADESMKAAQSHSNLQMQTLQTVFQQQGQVTREGAERQRISDERKAAQDREFYDRQRQDTEQRLTRERAEGAARREQESKEWERRRMEDRERSEAERQRASDQRKHEIESMRVDADRRDKERALELERRQQDLAQKQKEDERRWETRREVENQRRDSERQDWERRETLRREEESRRERQRTEDFQRQEARRQEERERDAGRRKEETTLQMKQLEVSAQRDREHAERMAHAAAQEREGARESVLSREKMEREGRDSQEKERDRQMQLRVKEMEIEREKGREHQERMMQMQKMQSGGGLLDQLGMETPELLAKIFGGGDDEDGGGWADAIPKTLAAIAEVASKTMGKAQPAPIVATQPQRSGPRMIAVQTPEGVRMVPASSVPQRARQRPVVQQEQPAPAPARTFEMAEEEIEDEVEAPSEDTASTESEAKLEAGAQVSTIQRGKANGVSMKQQKLARRGIRKLLKDLEKAPEEEWTGVVMAALALQPAIFHFIEAVTVYAALAEANASALLAERIVVALKGSQAIPADLLPYDESDYEARAAFRATAKANEVAAAAKVEAEKPDSETAEVVEGKSDEN